MPSQKDIVEVVFPFHQQSQTEKTHSVVVISTEDIMNMEDGMFYGVLLSGEKQPEEFSIELTEDMISILNKDVQKKFTHVKTHMIYPLAKAC